MCRQIADDQNDVKTFDHVVGECNRGQGRDLIIDTRKTFGEQHQQPGPMIVNVMLLMLLLGPTQEERIISYDVRSELIRTRLLCLFMIVVCAPEGFCYFLCTVE